jgi:hypothetical protein
VLHNISPSIVDHDISIFLKYNLKLIQQERSLDVGWPDEEVLRCLVRAASGLFIWAAAACRFIREGKQHAARRLDMIHKSCSNASIATTPQKHLDEIYTTVLKHSIHSEYTDKEKIESYRMLRQVLGSIVILFSPVSVHFLHKLLNITQEDINQTLEDLHSIVDIPKKNIQPLRLHHLSFRDFLLSNHRCQEPDLWVEEKQAHQTLFDSCLRILSTSLKQDICNVNAPGMLTARIESSRLEQCLASEVQYSCLYWIQHLQRSGTQLHDNDQVHQLLKEHLLHWIEVLGWMRKVSEGIHAIALLESFASVSLSLPQPKLFC